MQGQAASRAFCFTTGVLIGLDKPDRFVSTAAELELNAERYRQIIEAGSSPYEVLGIVRKH